MTFQHILVEKLLTTESLCLSQKKRFKGLWGASDILHYLCIVNALEVVIYPKTIGSISGILPLSKTTPHPKIGFAVWNFAYP